MLRVCGTLYANCTKINSDYSSLSVELTFRGVYKTSVNRRRYFHDNVLEQYAYTWSGITADSYLGQSNTELFIDH
jgi:hypothetical protein